MTKREEIGEIIKLATEVRNTPLVIAKLFEKPKCKPWDIVRGRRFKCCHGLGEHTWWCLGNKWTIISPNLGNLSAREVTND